MAEENQKKDNQNLNNANDTQAEEEKKCCGKCNHENTEKENAGVEELQKKSDEYLNNWKRERADFLNYKKDEAERMTESIKYYKERNILKILPILDNIYLAQQHLEDNGLAQIIKQFEEFLKKEGIERIETIGKEFDPNFMEIVGEIPASAEASVGTVAEEIQKGYTLNGKVLRPAKVRITG